jgi:Rrf2 family iron-sulfur cluster assembly transcriptional regulator
MQISSSAYFGVETLVRLAMQNADKPSTTQGLAEWMNRSVSYTETLMTQLRNAGLVSFATWSGGGYILARPAHRITVAEVFQAVDAPSDFANRPLNADTLEAANINDDTNLLWEALNSHVLLFLDSVSLADLAPEATELISDDTKDEAQIYPFDMQSTVYH